MHQFKTQQILPISCAEAWTFFSSPKNLSKITPPEMDFKILTKIPDTAIYDGMTIDYKVKPLLGIPVRWQTKLYNIQTEKRFTDRQIIGPYKVWEHTHTFERHPKGVLMTDVIHYQLPLGYLGKLAERLFVGNKVAAIFTYRRKVLEKLFPSK